LIITPKDKQDLVLMQLEDLKLYEYEIQDGSKNLTQIFDFNRTIYHFKDFFCCRGKLRTQRAMAAIAIHVPSKRLDEMAEKKKIEVPLTVTNT
jgi:hypothetical protein